MFVLMGTLKFAIFVILSAGLFIWDPLVYVIIAFITFIYLVLSNTYGDYNSFDVKKLIALLLSQFVISIGLFCFLVPHRLKKDYGYIYYVCLFFGICILLIIYAAHFTSKFYQII